MTCRDVPICVYIFARHSLCFFRRVPHARSHMMSALYLHLYISVQIWTCHAMLHYHTLWNFTSSCSSIGPSHKCRRALSQFNRLNIKLPIFLSFFLSYCTVHTLAIAWLVRTSSFFLSFSFSFFAPACLLITIITSSVNGLRLSPNLRHASKIAPTSLPFSSCPAASRYLNRRSLSHHTTPSPHPCSPSNTHPYPHISAFLVLFPSPLPSLLPPLLSCPPA